jgi:hypothetical protein
LGAQPEKLGRIRALDKAITGLPASEGKIPAAPDRPSLPKQETTKPQTEAEARAQMAKTYAKTYSGPIRRFEMMPWGWPSYIFRQLLKNAFQKPGFREWLSKD